MVLRRLLNLCPQAFFYPPGWAWRPAQQARNSQALGLAVAGQSLARQMASAGIGSPHTPSSRPSTIPICFSFFYPLLNYGPYFPKTPGSSSPCLTSYPCRVGQAAARCLRLGGRGRSCSPRGCTNRAAQPIKINIPLQPTAFLINLFMFSSLVLIASASYKTQNPQIMA